MDRLLLLYFFCFTGLYTSAQTYLIQGKVLDADTREAIPFANVYFEGTTTGVATDIDGFYEIRSSVRRDSLTASALGYPALRKALSADTVQTVDFYLAGGDFTLQEVVVLAGENPANAIVRNIIKNKERNQLTNFESYQYERYAKVELDLQNIDEKLREKKLLKPFDFIFEQIDSSSDEKPFLPVYLNEMIQDVYYVKEAGAPKKVLRAQRTSGVDNQSMIDYIKKIHEDYSIYDNWIYVLEKPLISPFANAAMGYYEYYIMDSAYIADQWSYQLKFKPKRKQENTFQGTFWVADTTFAIQLVDMRMSPDVNINLVSRVIIYEEFTPFHNHWIPEKQKMIVDFSPTEKAPGLIARRTETFRHFVIDHEKTAVDYEQKDTYYQLDEVERDDTFWEKARHEPLSQTEKGVYEMVDSLNNLPIFRTYTQVLEMIFKGYLLAGPVEIGPYSSIYSSNPVEGHRFRLGLMTSKNFSRSVRVGGFLAYGLKDEEFKYGADFIWLLSKIPRVAVGGAYLKDVSLNSQSSEDFQQGDLFSGSFRRDIPQKLIQVEESKLFFERYWQNGWSNRLTLLHREMDPYGGIEPGGGGFNFGYVDHPNDLSQPDTTINTTEFIFKLRYAYKESFLDGRFERISAGTKYPIVTLQYALGVNGLFGGDYTYHKIDLSYRHYIYLNPMGWLAYRFKAGKVFGTVPFLLAEVHPGNESFFMSRDNFNTMNRYEFASDTYVSFLLEHHFDGFFFNHIPLLRKLNFRTVATMKGVMGGMSARNRIANQLNAFSLEQADTYTGFRTPSHKPFLEAGVGIENILKVIRVDALWRLSYLDNPEASRFAVRMGFSFFF